jgi:hypothetical protein
VHLTSSFCHVFTRLLIYVCEVCSGAAPEEREKPAVVLSADEAASAAVTASAVAAAGAGAALVPGGGTGAPEMLARAKVKVRAASFGLLKRMVNLMDANDIMAMLDLMTAHSFNVEVQLMGCMSLSTVILRGGQRTIFRFGKKILLNSLTNYICEIMVRFVDNLEMQQTCLRCLWTIEDQGTTRGPCSTRAMEHLRLYLRVSKCHFPDRIVMWYLGFLLAKTVVWDAKECDRSSCQSTMEVLKWCRSHFLGSKAVPKITVAIAELKAVHYGLIPGALSHDPRDASLKPTLPYSNDRKQRSSAVKQYCTGGWSFKGSQTTNPRLRDTNRVDRDRIRRKKERHDARLRPPPPEPEVVVPKPTFKLNNRPRKPKLAKKHYIQGAGNGW